MLKRFSVRLAIVMALAMSCVAQTSPAARAVDLTAADGTRLKASYFPSASPGPGVLLLHQCNKDRKIWDDLARQLASAGMNVVTMDLRGFGESGGKPQDKLPPQEAQAQAQKWPGDIDVVFRYLQSQPGVRTDDIGVGGASCGVDNSVQTAMRHPQQVKSLVLMAGPANLAGRNFLRQAFQLPILAVVADDDEFPPSTEATEWVFSLSKNPGNKFLRYPNGGHGAEIFAVHPELRDAIVDWYATTLIKTPGRAPVPKERWQAPPSVQMLALIDEPGGAKQAVEKLAAARKRDPKAVLFSEAMVNVLGYEHMQAGDIKAAIEILKLNAVAFPESANVYDSLSDAYLANGEKELARQNARKALELLASDSTDPQDRKNAIRDSAQQKLKQLGGGEP